MLVNRRTVRIEWAHCDIAAIVFYPRYFEMFDTSTHYLFEKAGWKKRELIRAFDIVGYPMVDTRAKFLVPSTAGDDVVIETNVTEFRNSSFDVEHKVFKPGPDGEVLAIEGFETRVWVAKHPDDPNRIKSRPIPEEVIRRLSATC
ncbi:acyl-CoA thioesterase [Blastochloris viridis]|uniref:4-hydroxybenzoyl-CoA thioesterase n=1 Tax=Blastochloris viridis TaxID=1079 RepID=A0A0H5BJL5_BLAVI|nr:thioesterase family protein [Blastochloris viridis]ALK09457.1 4-hydroxybenzoyl-CoA thioesterase [Blastochloris viridis]BAS00662.1 4-hydroxybenzoyl-CoA thioesterase family active site [Blastochloris viridis]CUU42120.1 4-hydroxybenzoyl-CoA thioesterase [Blastochloris viridis]